MAVDVYQWLESQQERARHVGEQATAVARLADWQLRLARAVRDTLQAHQPGPSGTCTDCAQRFPCRTHTLIAAALGGTASPPGRTGIATPAPANQPATTTTDPPPDTPPTTPTRTGEDG